MATIKDVAQLAGVSKATVSRIMNKSGSFSEKTIQRVEKAMQQLDYQPNEVARMLGRKESHTIALILPSGRYPTYGELMSHIEHYAFVKGYRLMLVTSLYEVGKEKECFDMLRNSMVDGIIIGSHTEGIAGFIDEQLPVVSMGKSISEAFPSVRSDYHMEGLVAGRHFHGLGCRRIAYVSGYPYGIDDDPRHLSLQEVCSETGMSLAAYPVDVGQLEAFDFSATINRALLAPEGVDAILAETDIIAMDCIKTCRALGYGIPEDIKLIGIGNNAFSGLTDPPLTTIAEDRERMAAEAVDLLTQRMENPDFREHVKLPVTLNHRKTT